MTSSINNKISIRSINLDELYKKNMNPYMYTIYVGGNGLPFKPEDIKTYLIEYKVNNHVVIIE